MNNKDLTEKIARYIEAKQELVYEMTGIAHLDNIEQYDDADFKRLCKQYVDARKEIPEDVLERLDNREKSEI